MKYLVVGAYGFIGSWICRLLAEEQIPVIAMSRTIDDARTRAVLTARHRKMTRPVAGDIRDRDLLMSLADQSVTHIISLAGILRPASEALTPTSVEVSLGGLLNLFGAARRADGDHLPLVYSSAGAVYGRAENHPEGLITDKSEPRPNDHYGVQRYAMELTAGIAWKDQGIPSIGLRPWIVYGAGREFGMTAGPSLALQAAAAGRPYHIKFGGRSVYHHVSDVARAFIAASRNMPQGAALANIPGDSLHMSDIIEAIRMVAPDSAGRITYADRALDAPWQVADPTLENLTGQSHLVGYRQRIPETIREYKRLLSEGLVTNDALA